MNNSRFHTQQPTMAGFFCGLAVTASRGRFPRQVAAAIIDTGTTARSFFAT
jgi:hypothetical protein